MAKYDIETIKSIYDSISEANRILPDASEVDLETMYKILELVARVAYGISTSQSPDEAKTMQDVRDGILEEIQKIMVYDHSAPIFGKPTDGQCIMLVPVVRTFTLSEDCAGSLALCGTAPHDTAVFSIYKNQNKIGTITFPAGSNTGVFSCTETQFNSGDALIVFAPDPADDDLSTVAITFKINFTSET